MASIETENQEVFEETLQTYDTYARENQDYKRFYPEVESDYAHMERMGYPAEHIELIPEELWPTVCGGGSHLHFMPPSAGETIVDLGSGTGLDVILASRLVGDSGRVVGVDVSEQMLISARDMCARNDANNVEFVSARIDQPFFAASQTNDILAELHGKCDRVVSNGVFNLCKDKQRCYQNAFDLLKPGGMFIFNDVTILPIS